jgi:PAS domain S-box-containing protein
LVDDNASDRMLFTAFLQDAGYGVTPTAGPVEAFEAATRERPNLLITDAVMHGMDGFELVRRLRAFPAYRDLPAIICSGILSDERAQMLARRYGVQRLLVKSSTPHILVDAVAEVLRQPEKAPSVEVTQADVGEHNRLLTDTLADALTELNAREEHFRLLVDSVEEYAIFMIDPAGRIVSWNAAAQGIKGYRAAEVLGRHVSIFYPPDDLARNKPAQDLEKAVEKGKLSTESWRVCKDGTRIWVREVTSTMRDPSGALAGFARVTHDISTRHQAQAELEKSLVQLRALSGRLEKIREEERTRIAREIHDDLGQSLTALKMDLTTLEESMPRKPELARQCAGMHELIDRTIGTVQKISSDLRPGHLDELGLGAAIEWQRHEFTRRTRIPCEVTQMDDIQGLDDARATAIFRIFQEALTNIVRHAQATRIQVRVRREAGAVVLEVRDNGRGIARDQLDNKKSIGLLGMRERAQALGGEARISGVPGEGTTVLVRIPLPSRTGDAA